MILLRAYVGEIEQGCIHTEEKMGDISKRIFCGRHSIVTAYLDILMESAENIDQEDLSTSKILLANTNMFAEGKVFTQKAGRITYLYHYSSP